jgi:hypothetical protein
MGERGNVIKAMHRELAREGVVRGAANLAIYDPTSRHERELVGRVAGHGLSDELNDRHYLIVDGVDARAHSVELARREQDEIIYRSNMLALLRRRELARTRAQLSGELGRFAVIEKSREFTLVRGDRCWSAISAGRCGHRARRHGLLDARPPAG